MKTIKMPKVNLKNNEKKLLGKKLIWDAEEINRIKVMHDEKSNSILACVALNDAAEVMASKIVNAPFPEQFKLQFQLADQNLAWLRKNLKVDAVKPAKKLSK